MMVKFLAVGALGAFVVAGPLQHVGVLPSSVISDASKATIKTVLNLGAAEAFAACGGGGSSGRHANNGFGNGGGDGVPGRSGKQDSTR